jgi:hypothetical protein
VTYNYHKQDSACRRFAGGMVREGLRDWLDAVLALVSVLEGAALTCSTQESLTRLAGLRKAAPGSTRWSRPLADTRDNPTPEI